MNNMIKPLMQEKTIEASPTKTEEKAVVDPQPSFRDKINRSDTIAELTMLNLDSIIPKLSTSIRKA